MGSKTIKIKWQISQVIMAGHYHSEERSNWKSNSAPCWLLSDKIKCVVPGLRGLQRKEWGLNSTFLQDEQFKNTFSIISSGLIFESGIFLHTELSVSPVKKASECFNLSFSFSEILYSLTFRKSIVHLLLHILCKQVFEALE